MVTKKNQAEALVNLMAAGGGGLAGAAVIPGSTALALIALESHMILKIGKIYRGESFSKELANDLAALGIASGAGMAAKLAAQEILNFIPGYGWVVKGLLAASTIKLMGEAVIHYFETHEIDEIDLSWGHELKRLVGLSPDGEVFRMMSPRINWQWPVMDQGVFWIVLGEFEGWKAQRNKVTGHCRIISPQKKRVAWAKTERELRQAVRRVD